MQQDQFLNKYKKEYNMDQRDLDQHKKDIEMFPPSFIVKTKEERLKDQCELLARMQTLMKGPKMPSIDI